MWIRLLTAASIALEVRLSKQRTKHTPSLTKRLAGQFMRRKRVGLDNF